MPIYEFKCGKCDHQFEELVARMGDVAPCPKCGAKKVERLISVTADYHGEGGSGGGEPAACPNAGPGGPCAGGACPFG
jgi:putative FmdB family regulatory protein